MSTDNNGISASFGAQLGGNTQTVNLGGAQSGGGMEKAAPQTSPQGGQAVKDITTMDFKAEVIDASMNVPVIVDFWAPWCGPCKQLAPVLEQAVAERGGQVKLVKMDIEAQPEIAQQMRIQSIPAVVAFKDGRPADAFMGVKSASEIHEFIDKLAGKTDQGAQLEGALKQAEEFLRAGEVEQAAGIYISILQAVPDNLEALVGLGMAHLANEDVDSAQSALSAIRDEEQQNPLALGLAAAINLKEQAGDLSGLQELKDKVDAEPENHQARFEYALGLNQSAKRDEAAKQLLAIIAKDRDWNDDGARTQLLQFFDAWGPADEATKTARRQLSSILFS